VDAIVGIIQPNIQGPGCHPKPPFDFRECGGRMQSNSLPLRIPVR
jgi:hypothetical protein